jgi:hypothetical protein
MTSPDLLYQHSDEPIILGPMNPRCVYQDKTEKLIRTILSIKYDEISDETLNDILSCKISISNPNGAFLTLSDILNLLTLKRGGDCARVTGLENYRYYGDWMLSDEDYSTLLSSIEQKFANDTLLE